MGSVLRKQKSAIKRRKSRKTRRGDKFGASIGDCSKINEVNESGDEEGLDLIEKIDLN